MQDPLTTIISQYGASPTLISLVQSFNDWIDPNADLDQFYNHIWNVDTATGVGLDVWGRIVGVGRVLSVATGIYFGFAEANDLTSESPFDRDGPFFLGGDTTNNFALTDAGFRVLILAKALSNITDGSIPGINQILLNLFPGRGNCFVTDGQNMSMTYTFAFAPILTPLEFAIVSQSGALPKPVGVSVSVSQITILAALTDDLGAYIFDDQGRALVTP